MHIGIFAERFIGRYGADRVCVILAEMLQQRGHRVTLVGARFSRAVLERFPQQTLRLADPAARDLEAHARRYLRATHYYRKRHLPDFDACVVAAYPFVTSIPYLRSLCPHVVFLDFGVVPTFGYNRQLVRLIEQLQANRRRHLADASHVVAISSFIVEDQSRKDCRDRVPVSTVLLGADHLVRNLGYTERHASKTKSYTQRILEELRETGRKLILALGRWEPGCYKNSQVAYGVLRSVMSFQPDATLLVMADPAAFTPDPGLEENVACIGLPSDADLLDVIRQADAGISVSLWEGFNLPLAELQYLGKPVFAFDLAAHPEVVVSPEQLCEDAEDMALKLNDALRAGRPPWARPEVLDPWREHYSWRRFLADFSPIVERAA